MKRFNYSAIVATALEASLGILPLKAQDQCVDWVSGGGFVLGTPNGGAGRFSLSGAADILNGEFWGFLSYIAQDMELRVTSIAVIGYRVDRLQD